MICVECRETFLAEDEDDRIHVKREDGTPCGGWGVTRHVDRLSPI